MHNRDVLCLCVDYSKKELDSMYYAVYGSKPLTKYNKKRVAEILKGYVRTIERASTLLKID